MKRAPLLLAVALFGCARDTSPELPAEAAPSAPIPEDVRWLPRGRVGPGGHHHARALFGDMTYEGAHG